MAAPVSSSAAASSSVALPPQGPVRNVQQLPDDALIHILDGFTEKELARFKRVSKTFQRVAYANVDSRLQSIMRVRKAFDVLSFYDFAHCNDLSRLPQSCTATTWSIDGEDIVSVEALPLSVRERCTKLILQFAPSSLARLRRIFRAFPNVEAIEGLVVPPGVIPAVLEDCPKLNRIVVEHYNAQQVISLGDFRQLSERGVAVDFGIGVLSWVLPHYARVIGADERNFASISPYCLGLRGINIVVSEGEQDVARYRDFATLGSEVRNQIRTLYMQPVVTQALFIQVLQILLPLFPNLSEAKFSAGPFSPVVVLDDQLIALLMDQAPRLTGLIWEHLDNNEAPHRLTAAGLDAVKQRLAQGNWRFSINFSSSSFEFERDNLFSLKDFSKVYDPSGRNLEPIAPFLGRLTAIELYEGDFVGSPDPEQGLAPLATLPESIRKNIEEIVYPRLFALIHQQQVRRFCRQYFPNARLIARR